MKDLTKTRPNFSGFIFTGLLKNKTKMASVVSAAAIKHFTLMLCTILAAALLIFFFLIIKPLVFLPADILTFAETAFVENIIKLNIGEQLYTDPSDSNSIVYNPAAFLVTYIIALVTGQTKSVVGLRIIQIGFIAGTTLIAAVCAFKIHRLAFPKHIIRFQKTWKVFVFLSLFLVATAPYSNKFVYALHVDAFALLVSLICFWALLRYVEDESTGNLVLLSVLPAIGFLTKQSLIAWIAVIFVFLLFRHPKNFRRLGTFLLLSLGLTAIAFGICYAVWGDNYVFWTYQVLAARKEIVFSPDIPSISITRIADHLIRVWQELFIGIIGCWFLLKHKQNFSRLGAVSAAWLVLVASQAFSSGSAWGSLYHFGPGVLIGAVFIFAALPYIWDRNDKTEPKNPREIKTVMRMFVMAGGVVAMFLAWNVMPTGEKSHPRFVKNFQANPDVNRYIGEIEKEFEGLRTEKVLLGIGSWIYLQKDVLQKDRAISLADQPPGGIYENFDVTIGRIRSKTYDKILLQDYHSPYFFYEWGAWEKPTGFRKAVEENYIEIKTIKPLESSAGSSQISISDPVSVFVPRE